MKRSIQFAVCACILICVSSCEIDTGVKYVPTDDYCVNNCEDKCENNDKGIGQLTEKGETTQCNGVSCQGSKCGVCLNGNNKCENNRKFVCENGKWKDTGECGADDCQEGTLKNYNKKVCINNQWVECKNWGDLAGKEYACLKTNNYNNLKNNLKWVKCDGSRQNILAYENELMCYNYEWKKCEKAGELIDSQYACVNKDDKLQWAYCGIYGWHKYNDGECYGNLYCIADWSRWVDCEKEPTNCSKECIDD